MTPTEALAAWGSYNRDDPFPVFAAVRELGPVHAVTLADGHDAYLVVGYEEARVALNESRLSKDMHAALASGEGVVAEGLPGPSFARHMLSVDPPDHTRLRRLVSSAFTPRRVERRWATITTVFWSRRCSASMTAVSVSVSSALVASSNTITGGSA